MPKIYIGKKGKKNPLAKKLISSANIPHRKRGRMFRKLAY